MLRGPRFLFSEAVWPRRRLVLGWLLVGCRSLFREGFRAGAVRVFWDIGRLFLQRRLWYGGKCTEAHTHTIQNHTHALHACFNSPPKKQRITRHKMCARAHSAIAHAHTHTHTRPPGGALTFFALSLPLERVDRVLRAVHSELFAAEASIIKKKRLCVFIIITCVAHV